MVDQYHYELCWLIKEFCMKNKSAKKMVNSFLKANDLSCIDNCESIIALETILRVEMFISERSFSHERD